MIRAVILDSATLGNDVSFDALRRVCDLTVYPLTAPQEVAQRIQDANVVIVNKIKLNDTNLQQARQLQLICVAATGYDNIDLSYCRKHSVGVCNVLGYSTNSVAQLTIAAVLQLVFHLHTFTDFVKSGEYTNSGVANRLYPAFHELAGMTWGIVGAGNIGKKVARIASAFGCRVIVCRRTPDAEYPTVDIDTLCRESDIISVHTPLTNETRGLISRERIVSMKQGAIFANVARGAVADEQALADAVREGHLGGIVIDVYTEEPFTATHPLYSVRELPNVCLTPHMAWGAIEARQRCMDEIAENVRAYYKGERRCRVD